MQKKLDSFLDEIKKKVGKLPDDLHVTRKAGALVAISDGRVIHVGKPTVKYCPLFKALFGNMDVDKDSITEKFNMQFEKWGMFTCDRVVVGDKIIVPFGASEMMMYALRRDIIDSAVMVCEGAGTVITSNPSLVQGIGAYMNGVFYTSPVKEIIGRITENNGRVLDIKKARIDQLGGVETAIFMGKKRIAVTVRGDQDEVLKNIKELEKRSEANASITILSVCNTGISKKQAETIKRYSDIAWACSSKHIWETVGPDSILQLGMKIPVFVLTGRGISFVSGYSEGRKIKDLDLLKKHYVTINKFETGGIKINVGRFSVYLYETDRLPLHTSDEPRPLH